MKRIVIFGNSGSGKSTLAKHLSRQHTLAHLDLDTLAWENTQPPTRKPLKESLDIINQFIKEEKNWVIEGCYSDLIEPLLQHANEMYYLDLTIEKCINNAKERPWEPQKYATKEAQDANLNMLIDWISQYNKRDDTFSKSAHKHLFEQFRGTKHLLKENSVIRQAWGIGS